MIDDPANSPDVKRDSAYSLDALRYEQAGRNKGSWEYRNAVLASLRRIEMILLVIAGFLFAAGWKLFY